MICGGVPEAEYFFFLLPPVFAFHAQVTYQDHLQKEAAAWTALLPIRDCMMAN